MAFLKMLSSVAVGLVLGHAHWGVLLCSHTWVWELVAGAEIFRNYTLSLALVLLWVHRYSWRKCLALVDHTPNYSVTLH